MSGVNKNIPSNSTDVIVIGAGPVGLTLAGEFLRHGASVRIVEKEPQLCPHPNAAGVLIDHEHYVHEKYGVTSPSLYLIRPDGHIALRGGGGHAKELGEYLERVFA